MTLNVVQGPPTVLCICCKRKTHQHCLSQFLGLLYSKLILNLYLNAVPQNNNHALLHIHTNVCSEVNIKTCWEALCIVSWQFISNLLFNLILQNKADTYSSWYSRCCTPFDLTTWYSDGTSVSGTPTPCCHCKETKISD